jgi:type I restriction enzyme S subunit
MPLVDCVDILDSSRKPVNANERAKRPGPVPYYGATGQVGWIDAYLFDEELVLLGEDGAPFLDKSKPIAYVINGKSWVNNHAHVLRARSGLTTNQYLKYFLDAFDFTDYVGGSTRDKLTKTAMCRIPVVLPPFDVQLAMVRLLDSASQHQQSASDHLETCSQILERFRQSVLKAASAGRLTADWRDSLGRIDSDTPANWHDVTLNKIGQWSTGGTPSRTVSRYFGGSIVWVKSGDLRDGLVRSTEESLTQAGLDNSSAKLLPAGTVSVALYGATIGRVGILDIQAATNQACANCVPDETQVDRWFLLYFLLSQRQALIAAGQGGAQPNLTNQIVKSWPAQLPPLDEQREIVSRVEHFLAAADSIDLRTTAEKSLQRVSKTIFAETFVGHSGSGET